MSSGMIQVNVKLFGILQKRIPNYDPGQGIALQLPDDVSLKHLVEQLGLENRKVGPISINGRMAAAEDRLSDGDLVRIFQPVFGG